MTRRQVCPEHTAGETWKSFRTTLLSTNTTREHRIHKVIVSLVGWTVCSWLPVTEIFDDLPLAVRGRSEFRFRAISRAIHSVK
jgi:hypothetical protein